MGLACDLGRGFFRDRDGVSVIAWRYYAACVVRSLWKFVV